MGNTGYTKNEINEYAKTLTDALMNVDPTTEVKIANSIWAHHSTPFKPAFVQTNQTWYNAEVQNVDFGDKKTLDRIDRWCLDHTNNKIDKISEGMNADTRAALINAIYFQGKWKYKFDKSDTKKEPFVNSDGTTSTVEMINLEGDLFYANYQEWIMLGIPYGNQSYSMVLLMPDGEQSLDEKMAGFTTNTYYELFNNLSECTVAVKLPKFKAEYDYQLHKTILPELGLKSIFDPYQASLEEISGFPMVVNTIIHKTFIDVYEEGIEAAAVTAVESMITSVGPGGSRSFYVDRPFIYSIIEKSTGTILFIGRMNNFK